MNFTDFSISASPIPSILDINEHWCLPMHDQTKATMYCWLNEISQDNGYIWMASPLIGVASGLLTIASRVGIVFESLIKGVVHLGGCAFFDECSLVKGLELFIVNSLVGIVWIGISTVTSVIGIAKKTFNITLNPEEYTFKKQMQHEPDALLIGVNYANGANRDERKAILCYRAASSSVPYIAEKKTKEEHAKALLAGMYLSGRGVDFNMKKGFRLLKEIKLTEAQKLKEYVEINHVPEAAMALFGFYANDNNHENAIKYLNLAAAKGNAAMKRLAATWFRHGVDIEETRWTDEARAQELEAQADLLDPPPPTTP